MKRRTFLQLTGGLILPAAHAASSVANIHPFTRGELNKIATLHPQEPYWLMFWDLECPYCLQTMRNLTAAQKNAPAWKVVTVATDSIKHAAQLRRRIDEIGLTSRDYAFAEDEAALRFAVDPKWRGEKPRIYYYAPGQPRRTFSGVLTAQQIDDESLTIEKK